MPTTTYLKRSALDKEDRNKSLDLEFGIASSEGGDSMYTRFADRLVAVDYDSAKRIYDGMRRLVHHYGFDKEDPGNFRNKERCANALRHR